MKHEACIHSQGHEQTYEVDEIVHGAAPDAVNETADAAGEFLGRRLIREDTFRMRSSGTYRNYAEELRIQSFSVDGG